VKAEFDGATVRLGEDGLALYEQGGYGRPEKGGVRLSPEEALYLVHREKITVPGYDFNRLLSIFSTDATFIRRYLVYRDIRERGYAVQPGPHDFRVYRRGQKPGSGRSQYSVRVLSERDMIDFDALSTEATASANMRKQYVLAVVDDESELTYYEIKLQTFTPVEGPSLPERTGARLFGTSVLIEARAPSACEEAFYGKRLDDLRISLSPVEAVYLLRKGSLELEQDGETIGAEEYETIAETTDRELRDKVLVYADLRNRGFVPRTGYKFGHHFRVYAGTKTHSDLLVHAIPISTSLSMSVVSRSVRLAHSVKKKMLFACIQSTGIQYIEFARMKL
jgi:tRNA-intron endonuclease, archaea type